MPPQVLQQLQDPQALVSPDAVARITEQLRRQGEGGASVLPALLDGLRNALSMALHDVFLLGLGILLLAMVVAVFLREIPLRKSVVDVPEETLPEPAVEQANDN